MATENVPASFPELPPPDPAAGAAFLPVPAGGSGGALAASPLSNVHPVQAGPPASFPGPLVTVKLLRRRWGLALAAGLAGTLAAAAAVWFGLPPAKFTAQTLLYIPANAPAVVSPSAESRSELGLYQQAQAALIKSRFVLNAALNKSAVRELGIIKERPNPVSWLQAELKTATASSPEFLRLSMVGDRPAEMVVILDAVTDAYLREVVDRERGQKMRRLAQLTDIQEKFEANLRRKRDLVKNRTLTVGASDPQAIAVKQRFAFEALGMAERELLQRRSELRQVVLELKGKQDKERQAIGQEPPEAVVEEALKQDPEAAKLVHELARLDEIISESERVAARPREAPGLKRFYEDRQTTKANLEALRAKLRPGLAERWREEARRVTGEAVALLKERQKYLGELVTELEAEIERLRNQATSLNVGQIDIESNKAEIARIERISDRVTSEADSLRLELDAPPRVSRLEAADATQDDDLRRRSKAAGVAAFIGLCLGLGLVSYHEFQARRIDCPEQMSVDVGLPLLGTLPLFQTPGRPLLTDPGPADADRAGVFSDCVDAARARLVYAGRARGVRVVLVTSAVGGEGKTTLATHLAVSLARTGRKTVLLDGDMRRPAVHNYFGLLMGFGFSELLRGQARLADALQPSGLEDLWVVTAGRGDASSSRALARAGWSSLLAQLREQFEFVVIDSAPVLPLVDSLLLAQQADAVILSARRLVSRMTSVEAARQRLQEVGVPVLGVVLTAARVQSYGYRYPPGYAAAPAPSDGEAAGAR